MNSACENFATPPKNRSFTEPVSGEEPLRFRTDLPNLKRFRMKSAKYVLGLADPYETSKVLPLDTGSVKNLFF